MSDTHASEKSHAALSSVIWSAVLTLMKLTVGLFTGSLAIISDALHSGLDLLASFGTYLAVKIDAKPADENHPYGHGKIEYLAALAESVLLFIVAVWVFKKAGERLLSPDELSVDMSIWAFVVVILSLAIDLNRSIMLRRVAKKTNSAALAADAAHFQSDLFSSAAVLLGITAVAFVGYTQLDSWLHYLLLRADVFASLIVACIILGISYSLARDAVRHLMDESNIELQSQIHRLMAEHMPAYPVERLQVRDVGSRCFLDMVVSVPRDWPVDMAHEVTTAIKCMLNDNFREAHAMVHVHPTGKQSSTPQQIVRTSAIANRLFTHGLMILDTEEGPVVFVDLEAPKEDSVEEWNIRIEQFKQSVTRALPAHKVLIKLEPDQRELPRMSQGAHQPEHWKQNLRHEMQRHGVPDAKSIDLYFHGSGSLCVVRLVTPDGITVGESYDILAKYRDQLMKHMPDQCHLIFSYS